MAPSTAKSSQRAKLKVSNSAKDGGGTERFDNRETCQTSNVINYKLSDRRFLDIGWTIKPSARIARKVIQYETRMAKPHMNWFHLYRETGTRYYEDLRTPFIAFNPDESGQVFYPNGAVAIAVKKPEKRSYTMYTVFTPGGRDSLGRQLEPQMLAVFDGLGNGIVINEDNNTSYKLCSLVIITNSQIASRLTYNQTGGIYFDNKMPYLWTWSRRKIRSKIEEIDGEICPPHLRNLLEKLTVKSGKSSADSKTPKNSRASEKRRASVSRGEKILVEDKIHFDDDDKNIDRSRRDILTSLKIICLRLNSYLSLRILDRRSISLRFSSRSRSIRIELGTMLNYEKPILSYTTYSSEGLRGMLKCRFEFDNLNDSLTPEDSLYEIAEEYRKIEENKRKRRGSYASSETSLNL